MTLEELKALIQKATENYMALKQKNDETATEITALVKQFNDLKAENEKLRDGGDADIQKKMNDILDEISDMRTKMKTPAQITTPEQKQAMHDAVIKPLIGEWTRGKTQGTAADFFKFIETVGAERLKVLNITNADEGARAVAQVLSSDVIEYAREFSPILGQVGRKPMTRDFRELVLVSYPSVQEGIENVAGTSITETSTQEYKDVAAKVFKVNAKPRITDEATFGADIDLYGSLIRLLGREISIYLAAQVLYGNGTGKNARGILSSNRIDITDGTGKSWLPTLAADPANARPADYYPVVGSGISASLGADDAAKIDFLIKVKNSLPTMYRQGSAWHMNTNTAEVLEKIRDEQGNPVFLASYRDGGELRLFGYPVYIDDTLPDIAANSTPIIFGRLDMAFAISDGAIDKMLIDPYSVDGCTVIKMDKEMIEIVQNSDAIIVVACTANDGVA